MGRIDGTGRTGDGSGGVEVVKGLCEAGLRVLIEDVERRVCMLLETDAEKHPHVSPSLSLVLFRRPANHRPARRLHPHRLFFFFFSFFSLFFSLFFSFPFFFFFPQNPRPPTQIIASSFFHSSTALAIPMSVSRLTVSCGPRV